MSFRSLRDGPDMAVLAFCTVAAAFVAGLEVGDRTAIQRVRAEARCPAGPVARRVVYLDRARVECTYYRERPAK